MGRNIVRPGITKGVACASVGCETPTTLTKPLCPDHITQMPYAARLASRVLQGEDEAAGTVTVDGPLVELAVDSLVQLFGRATVERLRRNLNLSIEKTNEVVEVMIASGMVTTTMTRMGKKKRVIVLDREHPKLTLLTC